MITKHFFKVLIIFLVMIILGLIGVSLVGYFGTDIKSTNIPNNQIQVAK